VKVIHENILLYFIKTKTKIVRAFFLDIIHCACLTIKKNLQITEMTSATETQKKRINNWQTDQATTNQPTNQPNQPTNQTTNQPHGEVSFRS
jgi:hypothetical protein